MNIGLIGNYYGGLEVKQEENKFFWGIDNFDGCYFEEIPQYLYIALIKFEQESELKRLCDENTKPA